MKTLLSGALACGVPTCRKVLQGAAVLALLSDQGLAERCLANITMPDSIVDHGPQATFRQLHQLLNL